MPNNEIWVAIRLVGLSAIEYRSLDHLLLSLKSGLPLRTQCMSLVLGKSLIYAQQGRFEQFKHIHSPELTIIQAIPIHLEMGGKMG